MVLVLVSLGPHGNSRVEEYEMLRRRNRLGIEDPRLLISETELSTRERYEGKNYETWLSRYLSQMYSSRITRRLYRDSNELMRG